jgi:transglutaminase-like putative cysteine protease
MVLALTAGAPMARTGVPSMVLSDRAYYRVDKTVALANTGTDPAYGVTAYVTLLPPRIRYAGLVPEEEHPRPVRTYRDRFGNLIGEFTWPVLRPGRSVTIRIAYQATSAAVRVRGRLRLGRYDKRSAIWRLYTSRSLDGSAVATGAPELQALDHTLASAEASPTVKARRYFTWIVTHIRYNYGLKPAGGALQVLRTRTGICTDFAELYVGMLRTAGIPARLVNGYVVDNGGGQGGFHQWVELSLPGVGFVPADPTWGLNGDFLALSDNWHIPLYVGLRPDVSVAWRYVAGTFPYVAIRYHYTFAAESEPIIRAPHALPVLPPAQAGVHTRSVAVPGGVSTWAALLWAWIVRAVRAVARAA